MGSLISFFTSSSKYIVKSKGCYMYDSEGKKYIDFNSGDWAAALGHSYDAINNVIKKQVDELIHDGLWFKNKYAEKLSIALLERLKMDSGKSVFLNSGSEAVNLAIEMAKSITKREKLLKIEGTFLASYGHGKMSEENTNLLDIRRDDIAAIPQFDFEQIAAFVFEPGSSHGLNKFASEKFVETVAETAKNNGAFLIVNEVTTGFGRTAKWFGHHHYKIKPDIVATGKALGNGYPISAVSITSETAKMFENNGFRYAQSHQNDALGCAVGLEVIKTFDKLNLVERSKETGNYFWGLLKKLQTKHNNKIVEVRARGLMLALELAANVDANHIFEQLLTKGFVVGQKDNTIMFMPPLIINNEDIEKLVGSLDSILS